MVGDATQASRTSVSDGELVEAVRAGSREAFRDLVERYRALVCSITSVHSGSAAESEEVAQETFVAAWRQIGGLRQADSFRSWICGIARNLARLARRTERNQLSRRSRAVVDGTALPGAHPSALDELISREQTEVLRRALKGIPEAYRIPLVLFYQEQQSIEEVARTLDLSETNVKSRLSRGRQKLSHRIIELLGSAGRSKARSRATFAASVLAAISEVTVGSPEASAATAGRPTRGKVLLSWKALPLALTAVAGTALLIGAAARAPRHSGPFPGNAAARGDLPHWSPSATDSPRAENAPPAAHRKPRTVLSFTFEDGLEPELFAQGHVVPCGPGAHSRYCLMGTLNPDWPDLYVVVIGRMSTPLFHHSSNMVLGFDYWLGCDAGNGIGVQFWNLDRASAGNYKHYVPKTGMACESWGHAELRLKDFRNSIPSEAGDAIRDIDFAGGRIGGKPMLLDNITVVEYDPGDLPTASLFHEPAL